jgi:very-short-patch-repair endonuclease
VLERDVYRIKFLESRGWKIVRVWSRDWWQSRKKVLSNLIEIIEKQKTAIAKEIA